MNGAMNNGVKLGAYIYSYALTVEEAKAEAEFVLNAIKDSNSNILATTAEIKDTAAKILIALKPSSSPSTPPTPVGLEAKIDETNRLLKILCQNLVGKE